MKLLLVKDFGDIYYNLELSRIFIDPEYILKIISFL